MATHKRTHTIVDEYSGEFSGVHGIYLGQAGRLTPATYRVIFTNVNGVEHVNLHLVAKNSSNISMKGSYGFPTKTVMNPIDYGYGGAGYISDVPNGLLDEIEEQNNIKFGASRLPLVESDQECSYMRAKKCTHPVGGRRCVYCGKTIEETL